MTHTPIFNDGYIVIEFPHQGKRRVWSPYDTADLVSRINKCAERQDTGGFDMETAEGCLEFNHHDLKSQIVMQYADFVALGAFDDADIMGAADRLGWIENAEEV